VTLIAAVAAPSLTTTAIVDTAATESRMFYEVVRLAEAE
jgi:hypothetical protein